MDSSSEGSVDTSLSNSDVVAKYMYAAETANKALDLAMKACVAGASVVSVCQSTDKYIVDTCNAAFVKGKNKVNADEKGIAFPTCISLNHCCGHFSPCVGDTTVLSVGDVVKVDLAVHVHGFIAACAGTVVVCETAELCSVVSDRRADVIAAAYDAVEACVRTIKPGGTNKDVTEVIAKVASSYGVTPLEGVLSHEIKQFVIDGNNSILNKSTPEHKVDEWTFTSNTMLVLDVVMSSGEGKAKNVDEKQTTVYKRCVDQQYQLKMKASREFFSTVNQRSPALPFTLRDFDETKARLGLAECLKHDLFQPYPVMWEKDGEVVAQVKCTVMLTPQGTVQRIAGGHDMQAVVQSEKTVTDEGILALLNDAKKKKNKKKKGKE